MNLLSHQAKNVNREIMFLKRIQQKNVIIACKLTFKTKKKHYQLRKKEGYSSSLNKHSSNLVNFFLV
jgi:hypothetical protein